MSENLQISFEKNHTKYTNAKTVKILERFHRKKRKSHELS